MAGAITVGPATKYAHGQLISWLNALLDNYESGFWDWSIKNLVSVSFINKNYTFLQELYQGDGSTYAGFILTGAINTTQPQIIVFNSSGVPILYNNTDCQDVFEFDNKGILSKFYEGRTIPLYDESGNPSFELLINSETHYGTRMPFVQVTENIGGLAGRGFIDVPYDNKYSGTYSVETIPLGSLDMFAVKNKTNLVLTIEVPILTDLLIKYRIGAKQTQNIPATAWSDYFVRTGMDFDSFMVTKITNTGEISGDFDGACGADDIFTVIAEPGIMVIDDRLNKRNIAYMVINDTLYKNTGFDKLFYENFATFTDGTEFIGGEKITIVLNKKI